MEQQQHGNVVQSVFFHNYNGLEFVLNVGLMDDLMCFGVWNVG